MTWLLAWLWAWGGFVYMRNLENSLGRPLKPSDYVYLALWPVMVPWIAIRLWREDHKAAALQADLDQRKAEYEAWRKRKGK